MMRKGFLQIKTGIKLGALCLFLSEDKVPCIEIRAG